MAHILSASLAESYFQFPLQALELQTERTTEAGNQGLPPETGAGLLLPSRHTGSQSVQKSFRIRIF